MRVLQLILFGVVTGSFLLVGTIGFALTRRVEGFLNIAHAELITVSAFGTWFMNRELGWNFFLAGGIAVVGTSLLGLVVARLFYDPIKHLGSSVLLITSVGVTFFLHGIAEGSIGTGIRVFDIPTPTVLSLGELRITTYQLAIVGIAIVTAVGLTLFMNRTRTGMDIRAMAINRDLAASRGIDIRATSRATWLIASGLAGLAGVLLGVQATLTTDLAFQQILIILTVAIVGGLGSLYGVIAAAFLVGFAMDLSVLWLPGGYRPMVAFAVVIIVLAVRPSGLARTAG
ncbi:MAG: branched-chain amino acid ABC transporter permease [Actinobacteria bacterium]|uniref:High-affinity branched-chain amino acid transport system permease protein LivH (TC 3.A.1.4.1) n=1 Tax=hydrothermal vent metagenome TaxID=652676 RepID=A0A3B0SQ05_9ZZZZ|nr:branched-chain amino acid ABC transporter permease [Actinomycetota bacterium]